MKEPIGKKTQSWIVVRDGDDEDMELRVGFTCLSDAKAYCAISNGREAEQAVREAQKPGVTREVRPEWNYRVEPVTVYERFTPEFFDEE